MLCPPDKVALMTELLEVMYQLVQHLLCELNMFVIKEAVVHYFIHNHILSIKMDDMKAHQN